MISIPTLSIDEKFLRNRIYHQLSRIEGKPVIELNYFAGNWGVRYIPQNNEATDFCHYFAPKKDKHWTLTSRNAEKIRSAVDRFMKRIVYHGTIPLDQLPQNYGCEICTKHESAGHSHQTQSTQDAHNNNRCDEQ